MSLSQDRVRASAAVRQEDVPVLERLYSLGAALAGARDVQAIVQAITDEATAVTGAEFGAFFYNVLDESGESYMLYTLSGAPREAFERYPMPRNTPVFGPTFRGEGPVRSDDILADPRYGTMEPHQGMPAGHLPVRSYLAVPVTLAGGEVLGGLFFGHAQVARFTAAHERLAVGIAGWAAVVLDNARLRASAEREIERRRTSEEKLRLALDTADLGVWEWDIDTGRVEWNDKTDEIHGRGPGEFDGTLAGFERTLHPDDAAAVHTAIERAVQQGSPYRIEFRIVRPDRETRWLEAFGYVLREGDGRPRRMIGVTRDITDRRHRTEGLAFLAEAGRVLFRSLDYVDTLRAVASLAVPALGDWCAVDIRHDDGRVERIAVQHEDPAKIALAEELMRRYPPSERDERGVRQVIRSGRSDWMPSIPREMLRSSARDARHGELLEQLGIRGYISSPLRAGDRVVGAITCVAAESGRVYTTEDVERVEELAARAGQAMHNALLFQAREESRRELEQQATELELQTEELELARAELQEANDALMARAEELEQLRVAEARANRAKSDFLANMSHELRTPLNAIGGYVELLELGIRGPITEQQREDLARIRRSQQSLLALINDILNFARIEAGRVHFDVRPVLVHEVVAGVEPLILPQLEAKSLAFRMEPGASDATVLADPERLSQIILNLLSNAVKFTGPGGEVVIGWGRNGHGTAITVRDTGRGIPADRLQHIFDPFVQVERRPSAREEGVGLGLAISRDIARAMGGDVTAVSEPGVGSTFTIVLPQAAASSGAAGGE